MRRIVACFVLGLTLFAPRAQAGEAATRLSQCLTSAVTQDDRLALVRWIFSAMAAHPDLEGLAAIDARKREELEEAGTRVFERLIAEDCTAQSREAIVEEGTEGFGEAFKTLGEVAMEGVMQDAKVQASMSRLGERIDSKRLLKALLSR